MTRGSVGWNIRLPKRKSPCAMVVWSPAGMFAGSQAMSRSMFASSRVREASHCRVQRVTWRWKKLPGRP